MQVHAAWPDAKIASVALRYIRKHTMAPQSWRYTLLETAHEEIRRSAELESGESPLVSFFVSHESWYLLSTRRIIGSYAGQDVAIYALDVRKPRFGDFKGVGGQELATMDLSTTTGPTVTLQYETGTASMAPMYYFMFWRTKYRVLDKLRM